MKGQTIIGKDISKSFGLGKAQVIALDNVDIILQPGEMTLVKGPSGSGKSTLIAALGGLQKPDEGEVHVGDQQIWSLPRGGIDQFRREKCGFVFQSMGLFPSLTAFQQIVLPLQYMGFDTKTSEKRAEQMLEEVGLGQRRDSRPAQMSGGENQRVAIARMLAKDPKLIFADEPTSALDSANGQIVADLLHRSAKLHDAVVMCVTHDDRLLTHADRVIEMEDGALKTDSRRNGKELEQ